MQALNIKYSSSTPGIEYDPDDKVMTIKGVLLGQNPDFFHELHEWTRGFFPSASAHTSVHVQLSDIDKTSLEQLYGYFKLWEKLIGPSNKMVKVIWYVDGESNTLEDFGSRLGKALDFPFEIVKTQPGSNKIMGRYLILKADTNGLWEEEKEEDQELKDLSADDFKIMTAISDRLQKKLNLANQKLKSQSDEIRRMNASLEHRNHQLEETIDALTKAKAGRRASTIILILAVILFLLSEGIEEIIEIQSEGVLEFYWVILIKLAMALTLKPLERFVEARIYNRESKSILNGTSN